MMESQKGVILENVDGEDESDDEFDGNEGMILSKVERRRLNILSNRGAAATSLPLPAVVDHAEEDEDDDDLFN